MNLMKKRQKNINLKVHKNTMKKLKRQVKGITLIALVVTVIVLLILAGVALNLTIGQNGIFSRAQNAVETYDEASDIEKINLAIAAAQIANNGSTAIKEDIEIVLLEDGIKSIVVDNEDGTRNIIFINSKKIYKVNTDGSIEDTNSDFDSIYAAPNSQDEARNEGVIGIGTDGKTVDMDLWEYSLLDNGTFGLNTEDGLDSSGNSGRYSGYKGGYTDDGHIVGSVPIYISLDNGDNFAPVTSMVHSFYNCTELKVAPNIPYTVEDMGVTFYMCTNLEIASDIPKSVISMNYTFSNCTNLVSMPNIGENVIEFSGAFQQCINLIKTTKLPDSISFMSGSFLGCTSLIVAPDIPKNVIKLNNTFQGCISLKEAPSIIPDKVENMKSTFQDCIFLQSPPSIIPLSVKNLNFTFCNCGNLSGTITINAEPETFNNCFSNATIVDGTELKLTGSCSILDELREQGGNII